MFTTRSPLLPGGVLLLVVLLLVAARTPIARGSIQALNSAESVEASPMLLDGDAGFSVQREAGVGPVIALSLVGEFDSPVEVIARPETNETYVVEQSGRIVTADSDAQVVLDIQTLTAAQGEQGLLGAAFHPDADLLYVHYTDLDGDSVLAEYAIDPTTGIADSASHRQVFVIEQPYENHNGGELDFGPDGLLYLGLGDGGLANDPHRLALDLSSPLGKILRIDPIATAESSYTVPLDNPFVEQAGADPRIWSYGLRNPWKFSFDTSTGSLWIADVGQDAYEEINEARATTSQGAGQGVSFGWSAYEATTRFNEDQSSEGHLSPFFSYARTDGNCSISGGAVYRGSAIPDLYGWYVYADYCTGLISAFDVSSAPDSSDVVTLGRAEAVVSIASGSGGELYVVSASGPVYQLTAAQNSSGE